MYLIVFDGLEGVPKIASVAYQVPSYLLGVLIEIAEQFIIFLLHSFQFLLGALLAIRKRHDAGDFCLIIKECTVELSVDIRPMLELLGMAQDLHVTDGVDLYLVELELQAHHC